MMLNFKDMMEAKARLLKTLEETQSALKTISAFEESFGDVEKIIKEAGIESAPIQKCQCRHCEKSFDTQKGLHQHVKRTHGPPKSTPPSPLPLTFETTSSASPLPLTSESSPPQSPVVGEKRAHEDEVAMHL
jgi:hypothetical protein